MRSSFIIKGYVYGFKITSPTAADTAYPEDYIWVNTTTDTAYIFQSGSWVVKAPTYIKDVNTENPIYVIGETYLGEKEPGLPVIGPPGVPGLQGIQGPQGPQGIEASEYKVNFSWGDATPAILADLTAGETIYEISLVIIEPFDGDGATLSIGQIGDSDLFMKTNECDPKIAGVYSVTPGYLFAVEGTLRLFITPGAGASKGHGVVMIDY